MVVSTPAASCAYTMLLPWLITYCLTMHHMGYRVVAVLFMGAVYKALANRNDAGDVFPEGESWSYLTGVYFACITYSTVGLVPL